MADRHARIAFTVAAEATVLRKEMERNTPLLVLTGPAGQPVATAPHQPLRYWLN